MHFKVMHVDVNFSFIILLTIFLFGISNCTIDINLSEFEYLANHLHDAECRKLVTSLHYQNYDLPDNLDMAEDKIPLGVPCLQQLLHWNSENGTGKGETHEFVSRRLSQIGREDLATWLTKKSYIALEHDFERKVREAFIPYEPIRLRTINLTQPLKNPQKEEHTTFPYVNVITLHRIKNDVSDREDIREPTIWSVFDTISWTIVVLLFVMVIVLSTYLGLNSTCMRERKRQQYDYLDDEDEYSASPQICNSPVCLRERQLPSPTEAPRISEEPSSYPVYKSEFRNPEPLPNYISRNMERPHPLPGRQPNYIIPERCSNYRPPETNYRPPESNYRPPETNYHPPETNYRPPETNYHPPETNYHPPETNYHQPETNYHQPETNYRPPETNYRPPETNYPQTEAPGRIIHSPIYNHKVGSNFRNASINTSNCNKMVPPYKRKYPPFDRVARDCPARDCPVCRPCACICAQNSNKVSTIGSIEKKQMLLGTKRTIDIHQKIAIPMSLEMDK